MPVIKLPLEMRPDTRYRKCSPGVDLPAWFIADIRSIDQDIYPVFHGYRLLWEQTVINNYIGKIDEARYKINYNHGELNFGYVLHANKQPLEQPQWHLWRLSRDNGWAHIFELKSKREDYLSAVVKRLYYQAKIIDRYGPRAYRQILSDGEEKERSDLAKLQQEYMNAIHEENSALMRTAMDNFSRGKTAPTNPTKETISSFGGQSHRSRLTRPLDDEDVIKLPN